MRRVYVVRSPWRMFVRWCVFFGGLFLLLTGIQYTARFFFESAGAFFIVAVLVAAVFWVGSRLGR